LLLHNAVYRGVLQATFDSHQLIIR